MLIKPVDETKPHVVVSANGERTHFLGEVHIKVGAATRKEPPKPKE